MFLSKKDFLTFFSERNFNILVAVPLVNFRRVKTCVAIQTRKNGKRKTTRTRKKRSGRINAKEKREEA